VFFLNYWSILGGREGERADKLARSGAAAAFSWMRLFCYNAVEAFRDDISSVAYTSSARTERKRGIGERGRAPTSWLAPGRNARFTRRRRSIVVTY